jgi:hypothetical protein
VSLITSYKQILLNPMREGTCDVSLSPGFKILLTRPEAISWQLGHVPLKALPMPWRQSLIHRNNRALANPEVFSHMVAKTISSRNLQVKIFLPETSQFFY